MNIIEIILKFLPFVGLLTFIKVVWEYNQSQKWKKSEFLAKEIKEFINDPDTKVVFQLLDWNLRKVNLRGTLVVIDDLSLSEALKSHHTRNKFEPWEAELRDVFDKFFDKVSTFQIYIKNGLIEEKELNLFIGYYIKILTDTSRKPKVTIDGFKDYLVTYQFDNVLELIESFKKY